MISKRRFAVLSVCASLVGPVSASAAAVVFTKLVETGSQIPDRAGTFTGFGSNPSISGDDIVFLGCVGERQGTCIPPFAHVGIYLHNRFQGLRVIADVATPIPGGIGNFTDFGFRPVVVDGEVAFSGQGVGISGVYLVSAAAGLNVVADSRMFADLIGDPDLDDGVVVFAAAPTSRLADSGIYTSLGGPPLVELGAVAPGAGVFRAIGQAFRVSNRLVAFTGVTRVSQTVSDIYTVDVDTGVIALAVQGSSESIPPRQLRGLALNDLEQDRTITFTGRWSGDGSGIYTITDGRLALGVDVTTPVPQPNADSFLELGPAQTENGTLALSARHQYGLRLDPTGSIGARASIGFGGAVYILSDAGFAKLIGDSDSLDGKRVVQVDVGSQKFFSGQSLVFRVLFADGGGAIYRADLGD